MFQRLEEVAMNAWPALQQVLYDGWLLRFSQGYTRRSNSVNPLYDSTLPLDEKIAYCEAIYAAQNLPCIFRLTPSTLGLDQALERRGYVVSSRNLVLHVPQISSEFVHQAGELALDEWLDLYNGLSGSPGKKHPVQQAIIEKMIEPYLLAMVTDEHGKPVGCGLASVEGEFVGFFNVVVDATKRGQGYGFKLMTSMLSWGREYGASQAYLLVEEGNAPARHLYESKCGFQTAYRYWYRVMDEHGRKL
jgi:ribosomal protein S18 acetylase RimI-like enzyme